MKSPEQYISTPEELKKSKKDNEHKEREWHKKDGVIYSSVISDGTSGTNWLKRLEKKGFKVSGEAREMLVSKDFISTNGIKTEVAILTDELFPNDNERTTSNILAEASLRNLEEPSAEVACLIREKLLEKDFDYIPLSGIMVMHKPIKDSLGFPMAFSIYHDDERFPGYYDPGYWLKGEICRPDTKWSRNLGFAFAIQS